MTGNGRLETALPWLFVIGFLLVWQLACLVLHIPAFVLPSPALIAASLQKQIGPIMENSWVTLLRTLVGFAIAVVLGVLLGLAIGMFRFIYRGLYPVLVGFNSIPKVAVVPVFVIWFGIGTIPAVLTAFLVSFFPIAVNVATGLATIEPELLDVMRVLGAKRRTILMKIGLTMYVSVRSGPSNSTRSPTFMSFNPRKKPSRWPAIPMFPPSPNRAVPVMWPTPRLSVRSSVPSSTGAST